MAGFNFKKTSAALLVMDCQEDIVSDLPVGERERLMAALQKALYAARTAAIPIIHIVVQFRETHPEIGSRGFFKTIKESGGMVAGSPGAEICREVRPQPGELIITKKRIGAFTGSDLEQILRSKCIDTIFLAGVSSVGVVESTARQAVDMDFDIVVLSDGCADRDPKTNEAALKYLIPRIGRVISIDTFIAALDELGAPN